MNEDNRNYFLGIIGGLLGGLIASIPWIVIYVFGNLIMSLLATLIAFGVFYGYKLFKGKTTKYLPTIVSIISILVVVLIVLVISPLLMLYKEGLDVSISALINLYKVDGFMGAIVYDFIISVLFTILGIWSVVSNIKKQLNSGLDIVGIDNRAIFNNVSNESKNDYDKITNIFSNHKRITKENLLLQIQSKFGFNDLETEKYFKKLVKANIIKKDDETYYFNENIDVYKFDAKLKKSNYKLLIYIFIAITLICVIIGIISSTDNNINNPENNNSIIEILGTEISLNDSDRFEIYDRDAMNELEGEDYLEGYDYLIFDNHLYSYIYVDVWDKDDYKLDDYIQSDYDNILQQYNNVSEIGSKKINNINFNAYSFNWTSDEETYYELDFYAESLNKYVYFAYVVSDNYTDSDIYSGMNDLIISE